MTNDERKEPIDFREVLGVRWPVETSFGPVIQPLMSVSVEEEVHRITLPEEYEETPSQYWGMDWVNFLVRALMVESLDRVFGSVYFGKAYDDSDPETRQRMAQMVTAQSGVEIWVADKLSTVDRGLVGQDVDSSLAIIWNSSDELLRAVPGEVVLGWSMSKAIIARSGMRRKKQELAMGLGRIRRTLGREYSELGVKMGREYTRMPRLAGEREVVLEQFEAAAQGATVTLGYEIVPRLVEMEGDQRGWVFD